MPEDTTSLFVHRVLESPWPTVVVLALLAAMLLRLAFGRDDRRLLAAGVGLTLAATAVGIAGSIVETDREAALAATRSFVKDAVAGEVDRLVARLEPGATLHVGGTATPGFPREDLVRALDQLDGEHRILDNTITLLDASDDGSGVIWVELACLTRTESSYGTVPSRWIFEWTPGRGDDPWSVRSIAAVSVAGRKPSGRDVLR